MRAMLTLWTAVISSLLFVNIARAKIGYFWHITDIHYDVNYSVKGDMMKHCWRTQSNGVPSRRPGKYGDYNCDSPWALVQSAAHAMKWKHGDNLEFILWTGDALSGHAIGRSSLDQEKALENITYLLKETFPSQFVFPVLGHDDPGSSPGERLGYKDVGGYWRQWLPPDAISTFNGGGYYTIDLKENKLRIVALNTNLYMRVHAKEDPYGQWHWLETVLTKAQKNKEFVYLVGHMAPGADERQPEAVPQFSERAAKKYVQLVRRFSNIIVGQFFGHLHSDTFRVIFDEMNAPVNWIFLAPAVSPRRTTSGPNNPGIRLYKFETTTGQVLDYTQYYMDLSLANSKGQPLWEEEYTLTSYYGLTEVTPKSLAELASTFQGPNWARFANYYAANAVRIYDSPEEGKCDTACAQSHFCAVTRLELSEFRVCLEAAASALSASSGRPSAPALGLLAAVLLAAHLAAGT